MATACENDVDLVSVQIETDTLLVGHDRERNARSGRRIITGSRATCRHPGTDIVMGEDECALLPEILVPARMVEMPVGVDEKFHRSRAKVCDGCLNLAGKRGKLVVDQNRAVCAVTDADIAARTEEDGNAGSDLLGSDFNRVEIALGHRRRCEQHGGGGSKGKFLHGKSPQVMRRS